MSKNISEIDKNFKVETKIKKDGMKFYDSKLAPFKVYGLFHDGKKWCRLPEEVAKNVSDGVRFLHDNTAGGRIRFKTDSPYVAINAVMHDMCRLSECPFTGTAGFDIYTDGDYQGTYIPEYQATGGYEGIREFDSAKMREIIINFPVYSKVSEIYVGLAEGATVLPAEPYKYERPVVFYGSSITQGGCASRAGNSYQGFLSRMLDTNFVNLGFSGKAMGEEAIANYIKTLDMSVFVYDYDFNAPDLAHLEATHERMFKIIREANPTLPIIIMSKPKFYPSPADLKRKECIRATYENAKAAGDENVYFIDGKELMSIPGIEGTVDSTHPTDLGFYSIATRIYPLLKELLEKEV